MKPDIYLGSAKYEQALVEKYRREYQLKGEVVVKRIREKPNIKVQRLGS